MADMVANVAELKKLFDQYAGKEGNPNTLSKKELKQMMKEKMGPCLLKGGKNPEKVDKIFARMDKDGDGEVDFAEFMKSVAEMTSAVNGWQCKQ